jgi:hypothetical protein
MPKQKPTLVQYYAEGWRCGYLVRAGYKWTIIRRILPLYAKPQTRGHLRPLCKVATSDVREVAQ